MLELYVIQISGVPACWVLNSTIETYWTPSTFNNWQNLVHRVPSTHSFLQWFLSLKLGSKAFLELGFWFLHCYLVEKMESFNEAQEGVMFFFLHTSYYLIVSRFNFLPRSCFDTSFSLHPHSDLFFYHCLYYPWNITANIWTNSHGLVSSCCKKVARLWKFSANSTTKTL